MGCCHRVSVGIASLFVVVVVVTRLRVLTIEEVWCGMRRRLDGARSEERGVSRGVRCESRGGEWRQRVPEDGRYGTCNAVAWLATKSL
jgi:hypothetical protein